jgi:HlyD family secretion protein
MKRTLFIPVLILFFLALALTGCTAIGSLGGSGEPTPLPVVTESAGVMAEGGLSRRNCRPLVCVRGEVAEINARRRRQGRQGHGADPPGGRGIAASRTGRRQPCGAVRPAPARHPPSHGDIARVGVQQELIAASLAVSQARMALDEYTTQEFRDELDDKELAVQEAKDDLEEKQDTLDKYLNLEEDNPTRKSAQEDVDEALSALHEAEYERDLLQAQHDQAQAALDLALARQAEAQRSLDARADGPDQEELALAEANLQADQSQLAAAQAALDPSS